MRKGTTLLEIVAALTVVGILFALATPTLGRWLDRLATQRATDELISFYTRARFAAIATGARVRLEFTADSLRAIREGDRDSILLLRPGPQRYGASLTASRTVIRVQPNGFGWGAANTKLVVRRGAAAESVTTSRLGRLKRWK